MRGRRIVVGADDSPESAAALAWAAAEARPGLDEVHVVHAFALLAFTECAWAPAVNANGQRRMSARALVGSSVRAVRRAHHGLDVGGSAVVGNVVAVLTDMSLLADLLVIGGVPAAGRTPPRTERRIGRRVAARADCPVVVVPGGEPAATTTGLPVAVLLHDPNLSPATMEFAFAAAADRSVDLVVTRPWALGLEREPATRGEVLFWETAEQKDLDAALARWRERYPDVPVVAALRRESSYVASQELQRAAQLLVVSQARTGRPGLAPLPSLALRRPRCPVAVVPEVTPRRPSPAAHTTPEARSAAAGPAAR